jgi:hypothetical protein
MRYHEKGLDSLYDDGMSGHLVDMRPETTEERSVFETSVFCEATDRLVRTSPHAPLFQVQIKATH